MPVINAPAATAIGRAVCTTGALQVQAAPSTATGTAVCPPGRVDVVVHAVTTAGDIAVRVTERDVVHIDLREAEV